MFLDQDAVPTLGGDHARPRRLAERWPSSRGSPATRPSWRPNVALQVPDAPASVAALAEHRLRIKARSARHVRQLTHLDVAHEGIERARARRPRWRGRPAGEAEIGEADLDLRLQRLLFFADGVYAIAVTLLAVELVLPEAASHLHGEALLHRLLDAWPRVLACGTSFLFIANFWVGHNMIFFQVRRFDGVLMWLALVQLMCVAFLPFPTSVVGEHISDPVAQQFYLGSLLVTGLAMAALWWYISAGRRLVDPDLSRAFIRRTHIISLTVPASVLAVMAMVAVGVGRWGNPLILAYLVAFAYIVLGALEGREPVSAEAAEPAAPEQTTQAG